MHDILVSILLGVVEGLTEFLPVSSTAHLRIVQVGFLHIPKDDAFWKMFSIVIQLGAILCLPVYFWNRISKFIRTFPRGERGNRSPLNHPLTLVMAGFVVTALPSYLLHKKIGDNLENLHVMGAALLLGGVIMWAVDALFTRPLVTHVEDMNIIQAIWIGAVQILSAVFPGTSRSMCTIAAGQTIGMSRASALEFSFFLSLPTMFVATLYSLYKDVIKTPAGEAHVVMNFHRWVLLGIGFVVSFIVALVVVAWFMHWVRRRGFTPFAVYRIIVGVALLFWLKHNPDWAK